MHFDVVIAARVLEEDFPELPGEVVDDLLGDAEDPDDLGKVGVLSAHPEAGKALSGSLKGLRRLPLSGRYRVIYTIDRAQRQVAVLMVGIRRQQSKSDVYAQMQAILQRLTVEDLVGADAGGAVPASVAVHQPPKA